jgi:DHA2 family multidrug resistance protein
VVAPVVPPESVPAAKPRVPAERPAAPLALITITVLVGTLMAVIDTSIVNVALDTMAGNLGASIEDAGWITTGYILSQVIVMPLNGWLTARFGRRNFYVVSLALFTGASFLCGTASNVWVLVVYRFIQGIGGGALQPTAQAILFRCSAATSSTTTAGR